MNLSAYGLPEKALKAFYNKNIFTTRDVVKTFPRKYHIYADSHDIQWYTPGEYAAVSGVLSYVEKTKRRFSRSRWGVSALYIRILPPDIKSGTPFGVTIIAKGEELKNFTEKYGHMAGKNVVVCGRVKPYTGSNGKTVWEMDDISRIVSAEDYHPHIHCIYSAVNYPRPKGHGLVTARS